MTSSSTTALAGKPVVRLLYVDDEPALVELAMRKLGGLGYAVTGLTDSGQAWSLFQDHPDGFDVVVSDLTMPGPTGEELARQMRGLRRDLPIVLVSGYDCDFHQNEAADSEAGGAVEYLYKPFRMEELDRRVRELLARKLAAGVAVTAPRGVPRRPGRRNVDAKRGA